MFLFIIYLNIYVYAQHTPECIQQTMRTPYPIDATRLSALCHAVCGSACLPFTVSALFLIVITVKKTKTLR